MAELKWTNVNDGGANNALSNYLNASQSFRHSIMQLGTGLSNFTDVMNAGDASNNKRIRDENTQAIINRANSITSQEEMDKLINSGALSNDTLRQKYGWAIDMDKVNAAQANLSKDVYQRANSIDKTKDYNSSTVELDSRIALAKARGDNNEYQRLLSERAKLGSINTTAAMATDGYNLTKDIWDKQAKGMEAISKNTTSLDSANTALAQAQLNAQPLQEQINKWAASQNNSIEELLSNPSNLSNPNIAPYIQQYNQAMLGIEQANTQVQRVQEERKNIANLFGLNISNSDVGSNSSAVVDRIKQTIPNQSATSGNNTGSTSQSKTQYEPGTFESVEQKLEKVRDKNGNVSPQQAFEISQAEAVQRDNARAKQKVTIDQVEDSTGILNVIASKVKSGKGKYTDIQQIMNELKFSKDKADQDNHRKLVDLIATSPDVFNAFADSINLQLNNPNSFYADESEKALSNAETTLTNSLIVDIVPQGDSSLFSPLSKILSTDTDTEKVNSVTLTRDTSEKGKEINKKNLFKAVEQELTHQGILDSTSSSWYHITNSIKKKLDNAIDSGADTVDLYRGFTSLQESVGKGNEIDTGNLDKLIQTLLENKHQIPEWRSEFKKQSSAIKKGLNHPLHRELIKSELYTLAQNKTLDSDDVIKIAKGVGVPLEGFSGKPALTAQEEQQLNNAMAVLEKYTFNSNAPSTQSSTQAVDQYMKGQYHPYIGTNFIDVQRKIEKDSERKKRLDKIPKEIQREIHTVMLLGSPKQKNQIKAYFGIK